MEEEAQTGHQASWKSRAWPGPSAMLSSWVRLRSTGPGPGPNHGPALLLRRLSMWTILLIRVLISVLMVILRTLGPQTISVAVGAVLLVLNLVSTVWCLTMIDRAEGVRDVFCLRIGRKHLDVFVVFCAVSHILMLAGFFTFTGYVVANIVWFLLWALLAGYGFICCKASDYIA
ncbi:hypothetical protein M406DRAFT_68568 [Cryphonectria parasitica EP155]|uniref:Uncharacterized protein n=1 Tax=Cryphonectria parasitica (strain ATCC 38755 / EP155) TaxID=660469 RepID=A0A9P5CQG1_CRYP1|nr:uncharacterized protein M406DRAFT_68568 [Cryphonectria parasitica EP155]KAF3766206.1 hypothetical protein M406DRAFT_68568 [Cryphonectria parasitica EP155]